MRLERIEVTTRDEYRGAQEPTGFCWRGTSYRVTAVVDRWYEGRPDSSRRPLRYFRVATDRGGAYLIRHHPGHDVWAVCLFEPPAAT